MPGRRGEEWHGIAHGVNDFLRLSRWSARPENGGIWIAQTRGRVAAGRPTGHSMLPIGDKLLPEREVNTPPSFVVNTP